MVSYVYSKTKKAKIYRNVITNLLKIENKSHRLLTKYDIQCAVNGEFYDIFGTKWVGHSVECNVITQDIIKRYCITIPTPHPVVPNYCQYRIKRR